MGHSRIPKTAVRYVLNLSGSRTHEVKVTMEVSLPGRAPVDIALPVTTPGWPRGGNDHPTRLLRLQAADGRGHPLLCETLPNGGWRVHRRSVRGDATFTVSYALRADEYGNARNHLDKEHAYLNGAATFMYVKGHDRDLAATVELRSFPNPAWDSASQLYPMAGRRHVYYAPDYQELADSNIEVAPFQKVRKFINGTEVVLVQHGGILGKEPKAAESTPEENLEDFSRIHAAFLKAVGKFPRSRHRNSPRLPDGVPKADRYVILKHYGNLGTALEHYHGQELLVPLFGTHGPSRDEVKKSERAQMGHELTHKLLGKYLQHHGIDSADLSKVTRTDGLWLTEGGADWLARHLLLQAGFITPEQYLESLGKRIDSYLLEFSVRPTNAREDSLEAQMGNGRYYHKGDLLATMLDMEIRHRTKGKKSFLDVLRALKREFGGTGKRFALRDVERLAERVGGGSFKRFFDDHLRGRKPIDFNRFLAYAGLTLKTRDASFPPMRMGLPGVTLATNERGSLQVTFPDSSSTEGSILHIPAFGVSLLRNQEDGAVTDRKSVGREGTDPEGVGPDVVSVEVTVRTGPGTPAFDAGLADFENVPVLTLHLKVKVPCPDGSVEIRDVEIPLHGTSDPVGWKSSLAGIPPGGGPFEACGIGFTFEKRNRFTDDRTVSTIQVSPSPPKEWTIGDLPNVSPEQRRFRKRWLA